MSELEAVETPVRNAKKLADKIGTETNYDADNNDSIEPTPLNRELVGTSSYQEWNDSPIQDTKGTSNKKKSSKKHRSKVHNMGILNGMTPSKILESAKKPVLSTAKKSKTPLNRTKKSKGGKSSGEKEKKSLEKVFSDSPNCKNFDKLAISAESENGNRTEEQFYTTNTPVISKYDMIQSVDENKDQIKAKKQRLKDLEEEILQITEKMTSYQTETDEIISDLQQRIAEREQVNQKIKEEPMFYTMNGNAEIVDKDGYSTSDELINMLKIGLGANNKKFFNG